MTRQSFVDRLMPIFQTKWCLKDFRRHIVPEILGGDFGMVEDVHRCGEVTAGVGVTSVT